MYCTLPKEETLPKTWWLAKYKIPWLLTDFEVEFTISLTSYRNRWLSPDFEKILFFLDFYLTVATLNK